MPATGQVRAHTRTSTTCCMSWVRVLRVLRVLRVCVCVCVCVRLCVCVSRVTCLAGLAQTRSAGRDGQSFRAVRLKVHALASLGTLLHRGRQLLHHLPRGPSPAPQSVRKVGREMVAVSPKDGFAVAFVQRGEGHELAKGVVGAEDGEAVQGPADQG